MIVVNLAPRSNVHQLHFDRIRVGRESRASGVGAPRSLLPGSVRQQKKIQILAIHLSGNDLHRDNSTSTYERNGSHLSSDDRSAMINSENQIPSRTCRKVGPTWRKVSGGRVYRRRSWTRHL